MARKGLSMLGDRNIAQLSKDIPYLFNDYTYNVFYWILRRVYLQIKYTSVKVGEL